MAQSSTLGARLKELRVARGMSQREAGGGRLSASYVSLVEAGKRRPTPEALRQMCEQLGTTPQQLSDGGLIEVPRSRAEVELDLRWAKIALRAGNPASAEKYARIVLDDGAIDESDRLEALSLLAAATEGQGRVEEAIEILESLQGDLDPDVTRELWLSTQVTLLRCYRETGDSAHAVSLGERAMSRLGDVVREEEMLLVVSLAECHSLLGNLTRARMLLTNVISRAEAAGAHQARGAALWNASLVAADQGRLDDAVRLSEQALAVLGESQATRSLARLHANCGYVWLESDAPGSVDRARAHFEAAHDDLEMEGSVVERARLQAELARCDLLDGLVDDAERRLLEADVLTQDGDDGVAADRAFIHLVEAHVLMARGRTADALARGREAAELSERHDSATEAARTWRSLAELALDAEDRDLVFESLSRSNRLAGVRPTRVGRPEHVVRPTVPERV